MRKLPYIILKKWRSWQRNRVRRWLYKRLPIEDLPYFHSYLDNEDTMEDRFESLLSEIDGLLDKWRNLDQNTNQQLSDFLHISSILGVDLSKDIEEYMVEGIGKYKVEFDNITPVAKEIYVGVNHLYRLMHKHVMDALVTRIKIEIDDISQDIIDKIRQPFVKQIESKFWVPLMRFGTLFALARDKKDKIDAYALFSGYAEQNVWVDSLHKQGYKVSAGGLPKFLSSRYSGINSARGRLLHGYLIDTWNLKSLGHLEWEFLVMFLEVPETHLKECSNLDKLPGYFADARRSLVCYAFHLALQIVILEYRWKRKLLSERAIHEVFYTKHKISEKNLKLLKRSFNRIANQSESKYDIQDFGIYIILAAFRLNSGFGFEVIRWLWRKEIIWILYFSTVIAISLGAYIYALGCWSLYSC
ncbi:MAG: hypothetical protein OXC62_08025 [Aestuariivita sp.]|nr:hypothetical protein [Aestuariivita sp.]